MSEEVAPDGELSAAAFAAAPVPVFVVDGDARIRGLNERAVALTDEATVGDHLRVLFRDDADEVTSAAGDGRRRRVPATLADGEQVMVSLRPLTDRRTDGVVGVAQPVSHGRFEHALRTVTHDLQGPFTVLDGSITLARRTGDTEPLERAATALERARAVVDDALTLAQPRRPGAIDRVDVGDVARDAWTVVDTEGTLRVESTTTVAADRDRLRHLLQNLLSNAVEHGATGETPPTVWVGTLEEGFYVADDGPGFSEGCQSRDRLFEPGYTEDDGSGLGLAIVARVAEEHGWSVQTTESALNGARVDVLTDP